MTNPLLLIERKDKIVLISLLALMTLIASIPFGFSALNIISHLLARSIATISFLPFGVALLYISMKMRHLRLLRRLMFAGMIIMPIARILQALLMWRVPHPGTTGDILPAIAFSGLEMATMTGISILFFAVFTALLIADRSQDKLEKEVAERREAERKVREQSAALADAVARTKAASQAKSEFVAHMSHEIRTPFCGVLGMTELAYDLAENEEQREYLSTARQSAESLLMLIEHVLDLSKIESGKLALEEREFDLLPILEETLSILRPQAAGKGLNLRFESEGDLPERIMSDPLRLRQVLLNLLGNAVKFTAEGEVVLHVSVGPRLGEEVPLSIKVRDTGIGLAPEQLTRIFEPFYRAEDSSPGKTGGTGLGLAISAKIVELLGGSLEAESHEGEGSVFRFTFTTRIADPAPFATEGEDDRSVLSLPRPLHVLLIEDNPVNQKVVAKLLEKENHEVLIASDGREGLARVNDEIDLVLMDIQMPELDGIAATRAIREREKGTGRHVPILALTAGVLTDERERCFEAGMDAFLSKPVTRRNLLAGIKSALDSLSETASN